MSTVQVQDAWNTTVSISANFEYYRLWNHLVLFLHHVYVGYRKVAEKTVPTSEITI